MAQSKLAAEVAGVGEEGGVGEDGRAAMQVSVKPVCVRVLCAVCRGSRGSGMPCHTAPHALSLQATMQQQARRQQGQTVSQRQVQAETTQMLCQRNTKGKGRHQPNRELVCRQRRHAN